MEYRKSVVTKVLENHISKVYVLMEITGDIQSRYQYKTAAKYVFLKNLVKTSWELKKKCHRRSDWTLAYK